MTTLYGVTANYPQGRPPLKFSHTTREAAEQAARKVFALHGHAAIWACEDRGGAVRTMTRAVACVTADALDRVWINVLSMDDGRLL